MSEPKKDQIAEAVVAALEGATIGAGYFTDLGLNVSRRRLLMNEMPSVSLSKTSVWIGNAEQSPVQCTSAYRERAHILVETIYRSEHKDDVDRDGIRCEADVKRAVLTDHTLGLSGTVTRLVPVGVEADHQEFADDHLGRRLVAFEVDYNYTALLP